MVWFSIGTQCSLLSTEDSKTHLHIFSFFKCKTDADANYVLQFLQVSMIKKARFIDIHRTHGYDQYKKKNQKKNIFPFLQITKWANPILGEF